MSTHNQNQSTTIALDLRSPNPKLPGRSWGRMEMDKPFGHMEMQNTITLPNTTTLFDLIALGSVRLRYRKNC